MKPLFLFDAYLDPAGLHPLRVSAIDCRRRAARADFP